MDAGLFIYFPRDPGQNIYFKVFDGQDMYVIILSNVSCILRFSPQCQFHTRSILKNFIKASAT